jgi:hypothetical protein
MHLKQLHKTLQTLGLILVKVDGNFANSTNIVLEAPNGTHGKFMVSRIDDPHSDRLNLSQFKRFARDHAVDPTPCPSALSIVTRANMVAHERVPADVLQEAREILNEAHTPLLDPEGVLRNAPLEAPLEDPAVQAHIDDLDDILHPERTQTQERLLGNLDEMLEADRLPGLMRWLDKELDEPVTKPTLTMTKKPADKTMREAIAIIHNEPAPKRRKTPKTIDRIGQVEFFKLCTVLNEIDLNGVDSLPKLADKLSKVYGRKIGPSTASDALTATGKKLDKVQVEVSDAQAIIARTLTALLIKLSEPVPDELRRLCGDIE